MSPERWQHLRGLFDAAIVKDPADRARMLSDLAQKEPQTAAEVRKLLSAYQQADGVLDRPAAAVPTAPTMAYLASTAVPALAVGSVFAGRYQILQELGAGGMGTVYQVFDTEAEKRLALK